MTVSTAFMAGLRNGLKLGLYMVGLVQVAMTVITVYTMFAR